MNTLQAQILIDCKVLQLLFQHGKSCKEIEERYERNLERLYELDKDFLNPENAIKN